MSLADFVRRAGDTERTLTVVNRTDDDAVQGMLESLFADQPVRVEEVTREDVDESNLVVLSDEKDGVVGVSSFESVRDTMLFVNSDLYITGARKLDEMETPTVLAGLDELTFSVRGYPVSDKEKMLLIEMSRYVEARALEADDGVLHTGFQQLSRIDDEIGTQRVYERLAASGVDVNVYGSGAVGADIDLHVHADDGEEIRHSWFVVLEGTDDAAALLAVERERNDWDGFWTYDPERADAIGAYLRATYW